MPSQPNFSDCGLFLIHYARQLLERPDEMLAFIQVSLSSDMPRSPIPETTTLMTPERRPPPTSTPENRSWSEDRDRLWRLDETNNLRHLWASIIDSLQLQSDLIRQGRNASEAEAEAAKAMESRQAALSAAPHVSEHADRLTTSQNSVVELSQPPKHADQPPFERASREASKFPVEAEEAEEAVETVEVVEQGERSNRFEFDFAGGLVGHGATSIPNGTKSHVEEHIDPSLYGPGVPLVTPSKIDPRLSSPGVVGYTRPGRRLDTRTWSSSEEKEPIEEGGMATLYSQLPAGAGPPADGLSHHDEGRLLDQRDHQLGPSDKFPRWKVLGAADNDASGPIDHIGDAQPDQSAGGDEDVFMGSGPTLVGPSHRLETTHETIVPERNAEMDRDILDDDWEQVPESQHPSDSGDAHGGVMGFQTQQGRVESEEGPEGGKHPRQTDKQHQLRSPIPGPYLSDRPEQDDQLNSVASTRDGSRSTSPNTTTTSDSKLSIKLAGFRNPANDRSAPRQHPARPQPPVSTGSPFEGFGNALNSRRSRGVGPAAASQSKEASEDGMEDLITATPQTRRALAVVPTRWAAGADDNDSNGVGVVGSEDTSVLGTRGSDLLHEQELAQDHVEPRPLHPSFDTLNPEDDTLSGKTSPPMSEDDNVPLYPMGNPRGPTQITLDRDALDRQPSASSPPLNSVPKRDKVIQYSGKSKGGPLYARKTTGNAPPSAKGAKRSGEEQGTPVNKAKRPRSGRSAAEETTVAATGRPRKGRGGTMGQKSVHRAGGEGSSKDLPIDIASTDEEAEEQKRGAGAGAADSDDEEDVEK